MYEKNIARWLLDPEYKDVLGCFTFQAKSGEVYSSTFFEEKDGFTIGEPSRPRAIWAPCNDGYGVMQAI